MDFQSIMITAPGAASLHRFSDDRPLADDEVEGPALASAISPGTEIGWAFVGNGKAKYPSGTGYAMVFRVERAGPKAALKPGDTAFAIYNHSSWVRTREAWKVPAGLDPAVAAIARLAGVSWTTLVTTAARPMEQVAIAGLGIVGHLAAQIFASAGYRVVACDPVQSRRDLLTGLGIELRDRLPLDDPQWNRIALAVDCSGHEAAVLDACRVVRKGGEVVLIGVPWAKRCDLPAFDVLHAVFNRYVHLRSGWEWEVPLEPADFRHGSIRENLDSTLAWLANGRLRTKGLFRTVDPRDCEAAYRELVAPRGGHLTAVFDWSLLETAR